MSRDFGSGETLTHALRDVSLELAAGQLTLVMGPSGCGKSTLLALLAGLLHPSDGQVLIDGEDLYRMSESRRREFRLRRVGIVFQGFHLFPTLTAREQLEMVLRWGTNASLKVVQARVQEMLERLEITSRGPLLPQQMSGGEKQRLAIGRALIKDPDICFADEPTSALDWEHGRSVVEFLAAMAHERNATVLIVTHDPRVLPFSDRVLYLEDGRLR
jgi:putative ABC transport system ATP-binding protein